jgi:phage shock protein E
MKKFSVLMGLILGLMAGAVSAAELEPVGGRYIIDVRTAEEWNAGHIDGAVLIPHEQVGQRIGSVITDKSAPIAVYCRTGRRSGIAMETLQKIGYTDVVNYGGLEQAQQTVAAARACPTGASC